MKYELQINIKVYRNDITIEWTDKKSQPQHKSIEIKGGNEMGALMVAKNFVHHILTEWKPVRQGRGAENKPKNTKKNVG